MLDIMIDSMGVRQLVREGQAAARAGDMMAARERFRRASELDPTNIDAWIGLSSSVPILAEKKQYLQKVMALDPSNAEATESLAYIEKLIGDGYQIAPSRRNELRVETADSSPLLTSPAADAPVTEVLHCYRHPDRETGLRCTNCNRPICAECAKPAAVGQLCPECRKERRPSNYKVSASEVIIGFLVAVFTSFFVSVLLTLLPFGLFAFFILVLVGPAIAEFIVRVVDRVTRSKRGRPMQATVGTAIVLGTLPALAAAILLGFGNPLFIFLYLVLTVSVATARLR